MVNTFDTITLMIRCLLFTTVIWASTGCGSTPKSTPVVEPLRIAAASDLQTVMPILIERFHASKGINAVATFGSSGQLAQQIRQGAPFDVFLSANRKFVIDLASAKVIDPMSVRDYAIGTLVLVVRNDVADKIESLADLRDSSVKKVALANPETAPYGAAAKQALTRAGLWQELEPKRVQAETVRQALQFIQTGNVEAALVGSAIAKVEGVRAFPIDPALYETLWQSVGVTTLSKRPSDAIAFSEFLRGDEGQKVLSVAGFRLPSEYRK